MFRVERLLQILMIVTVGLAGLLLGMGQKDVNPFIIAITGAISAFVLVDWLRWFHLPQWLSNLFAILVTAFTVSSFFFDGDSVRQLLGVGKLLVYLQTILLFQRKSARVYWQVLVLGLLQIVVGTIFNLGFEGGVLFILYMLVAGMTMMTLHLYQDQQAIVERNADIRRKLDRQGLIATPVVAAFTDTCRDRSIIARMFGSFGMLGIGSLGFAIFLFYFLPRENSSWSGPREVPMQMAGSSKSFTLDHSEMIVLSSRLVMTVTYRDPLTKNTIPVIDQPYLRGLALPNLVIDESRTTWQAPYDQIFEQSDYRTIARGFRRGSFHVIQDIVLEPTEDPLLFTALPVFRDEDTPLEFHTCWPIGAVTRQKSAQNLQLSHFRYSFRIPVLPDGSFFQSVPYQHRFNPPEPLIAELEPGLFAWLTDLEPQRYPSIVQAGQQLADETPDSESINHLRLARKMEQYFLDENRFTYSLDFRDVNRDPSIDSVEDFFANHRTGHCEYYASALTLMLRSQGIPARVVVGYRGGNVNEFGQHLDVEARHAHAWVEAYIRPGDCTAAMQQSGQAGRLGAWLRLDPTPASSFAEGLLSRADDAVDLAKSWWRDYVLGLQADRSSNSVTRSGVHLSGFFQVLDLDWWQSLATDIGAGVQDPNSRWWHLRTIVPIALVVLVCVSAWMVRRGKSQTGTQRGRKPVSRFRRRFGGLVRSVAPRLGKWIEGPDDGQFDDVPFYVRMTELLARSGFHRQKNQTQREFAAEVAFHVSHDTEGQSSPSQLDERRSVGNLTKRITDFYYLVRFGARNLDERQTESVSDALSELEVKLGVIRQSEE